MKLHRGTSRGEFGAPGNAPLKREPTYYEVLGIPPGSTLQVITAACRALCLRCHPDHASNDADLVWRTNVFATITQATSVLKDTAQRRQYDAKLALQPGACMYCQGKGQQSRQRGLTQRNVVPCERCNASGRADGGLTHVQLWGRAP